MKKIITLFTMILFLNIANGQTEEQNAILDQFLEMHRLGSDQAIGQFIKNTYHPTTYQKIDSKAHINFYATIIEEFGELDPRIYKKIESTSNKLVVHLIKKGESPLNDRIDPANILVVEIVTSDKNPKYMEQSLGLGSLLCQQKKKGR